LPEPALIFLILKSTFKLMNRYVRHRALAGVPVVAGALLSASVAHADRRAFTYTYEYATMAEGETAVELYTTQSLSSFDDGAPRGFQFQLEVEHGVTDRFDVALYQVFAQTTAADPALASPLHFDEVKVRGRYRFAERGELPVDPLLYLEVAKEFGASVYELEAKGIAARDLGKVTVALNAKLEAKLGPDVDAAEDGVETELEAGWAVGASYQASPAWRLGVESYGGFELEEPGDVAASVGPVASWAPSTHAWIAATAGVGLTDHASDLDVRFIIGLEL
jgi:hypothetical protein